MDIGDSVAFKGGMDAAFAHGLAVTALHNHFFYDEPKAYFTHWGFNCRLRSSLWHG